LEVTPEANLLVELPRIPADWEVLPLGDCIRVLKNGLSRRPSERPAGYPVSRIQTLTDWGLNPAGVRHLSDLLPQETGFLLNSGDILFSHINSEPQLGRSAVYEGVPPKLVHGMNLLRMTVDTDRLDPYFLNNLLHWYRSQGVFIRKTRRAGCGSILDQPGQAEGAAAVGAAPR
jgi:hypothetical protein